VIFVCDVSSLARNASVVAEHLQLVMQGLLASNESGQGTAPLLVLGHKADLLPKPSAGTNVNAPAAVQRVRTILERELERRRRGAAAASGAGGMAALGEEDGGGDGGGTGVGAGLEITGDEKAAFKFEKWEGSEVDVRASWVEVKRSSDEHATDDEEHEHGGERGGAKGEDGLAAVVQWIVDLR
jgi:signal recognition particle receptor subunit beta